MNLDISQKKILEKILDWYTNRKSHYLTLGGFAGTGKTTLIGYLAQELREKTPSLHIAFCSYTGKATRVLELKLKEAKAIKKYDSVSTIHSLIYAPETNKEGEVVGWKRRPVADLKYGLIILDEASMVNNNIWQDLLNLQIPILAVGDHGQLPPIEGSFNLMTNPELRLEQIYRQAENNPILEIASMARTTGVIPYQKFSNNVQKLARSNPDTQEFLAELLSQKSVDTLVLVGYNHTRKKLNTAIRGLWEFENPYPSPGDKVICLKNNHQQLIYNGMIGDLKTIDYTDQDSDIYNVSINFPEDERDFKGSIVASQFGALETSKVAPKNVYLFDFGYALTVHKAQGSQAKRVILFEERFSKSSQDQWQRWLYTAVTRAAEELYIIG